MEAIGKLRASFRFSGAVLVVLLALISPLGACGDNQASSDSTAPSTAGTTSTNAGGATVLKITGPTQTLELSMAELEAMTATEGYGGWKNKVGNITGPQLYRGVAIKELMQLVGGGATVAAIAADGYRQEFSAQDINGDLTLYDPVAGDELDSAAAVVTIILAYSVDGSRLPSDEGPLRIALVSQEADQVTNSGKWAKQVAQLEVQ